MERESSVWKLFTKKADFLATCNICQNDYSYKASPSNLKKHWVRKHGGQLSYEMSVSDRNSDDSDADEEQEQPITHISNKKPKATWSVSELTEHLQDHGEKPRDSDDEEYAPEVQQKIIKRKFKSPVWNYFEVTDDKMAICLLCKKFLNYASSISNLRKHLQRAHKEVNLKENPIAKRIYINGELYEIANEQELEENDEKVETEVMDPIYLSNDSIDKPPPSSPKKQQPKIIPKRHFSKVLEEPVHSTKNTCSEIPKLPRKEEPSYTPNTMASIDYFGQYVVSLLKELPKPVSDRLQSEIIKQIFTSKMALDSQTVPATTAATYEIKICPSDKNVTDVPEPVSYTVVQTNEVAEKLDDVTGSIVKE